MIKCLVKECNANVNGESSVVNPSHYRYSSLSVCVYMYIHVCQDLLCSVLEVSVSLLWPLVSMRLCGFLFYSADMICIYVTGPMKRDIKINLST